MTEEGVILWFNKVRGYGFILRDGLTQEDINSQIFVHISALTDPVSQLVPNQRVKFDIIQGKKPGTLEAMNVEIIIPPKS